MGKAKKAHRKKVANRNQQIANTMKMYEKAFLAARQPQAPHPSNFIPLTGSDSDKYIQEYFNDSNPK